MATLCRKLAPARRTLLSRRTKLTIAPKASAWTRIVAAKALRPTVKGSKIAIRSAWREPVIARTRAAHDEDRRLCEQADHGARLGAIAVTESRSPLRPCDDVVPT